MSFRGHVSRIFYTSNHYTVLSFYVSESDNFCALKNITATGYFFGLSQLTSGVSLEIDGEWIKHPKYGRQYKVLKWNPWAKGVSDVWFFLTNCVSISSDQDFLKLIISRFGVQTYNALTDGRVSEAFSESAERDEVVSAVGKWKNIISLCKLSSFLQNYKFEAASISRVFSKFGFDSVDVVSKNPYRLIEVDGISFNQVDSLAELLGVGPDDSRRVSGAILWVIRDQVKQHGHLFVRRGDVSKLLKELSGKGGIRTFDFSNLQDIVEASLVVLESSNAIKIDPSVGAYIPEMYLYERGSASLLSKISTTSLSLDLNSFLQNYERDSQITLSDLQKEAVLQLVENSVLVVTGAPGTGKTTLVRTFVQLFKELNISYMLMAPTGIAAKRLSSVTGVTAQTIHRALRYDGYQWGRDNETPLETQAVVCDEVSMVDTELFYRLLDALPSNTMLVLVGDDAQLPSVGPGSVLRELLSCKKIFHVRLEQIFRQAATSDIVLAAHCIRKGDSPLSLPPKEGSEFRFWSMLDEEKIAGTIVQMAAKLKSRDENFQVLSPKYEGTVGVNNLNSLLKEQLNPDTGQEVWEDFGFSVRVGDRLMVIKNDYKLNVYNGDIGKLIEITKNSLILKIHGVGTIPESEVAIPKEQALEMLKLAYAVTVHRCQGEEFKTIILPIVKSQGRMLQRNLFYTAITRAREKVWVLGDSEAILKAVGNAKVAQRNTVLHEFVV
jgi:exodeoxyribonuclease V alpha subunit